MKSGYPQAKEQGGDAPRFLKKESNRLFGELTKAIEGMGVEQVVDLVIYLHKGQKRPDGPYINHIMRVATRLVEEFGVSNKELVTAALLHDALEDQKERLEERFGKSAKEAISEQFGERVAHVVSLLTNEELPEEMPKEKKDAIYEAHVIEKIIPDADAVLVKLSDFADNAMRLDLVKNPKRRARLAKKYLPLIPKFTERLKEGGLPLPEEKRLELIKRLEDTQAYCEELA